jgi:hypothetical protein
MSSQFNNRDPQCQSKLRRFSDEISPSSAPGLRPERLHSVRADRYAESGTSDVNGSTETISAPIEFSSLICGSMHGMTNPVSPLVRNEAGHLRFESLIFQLF